MTAQAVRAYESPLCGGVVSSAKEIETRLIIALFLSELLAIIITATAETHRSGAASNSSAEVFTEWHVVMSAHNASARVSVDAQRAEIIGGRVLSAIGIHGTWFNVNESRPTVNIFLLHVAG